MLRYSVIVLGLAIAAPTWAHGGKLDSYGCHNYAKTGQYHCHKGPHIGQAFSSKQAMLNGEAGTPIEATAKQTAPRVKAAPPAAAPTQPITTPTAPASAAPKQGEPAKTDKQAKTKGKKEKHKNKKQKADQPQPAGH